MKKRGSQKIGPSNTSTSLNKLSGPSSNDLSSFYSEHTWNLNELVKRYPDSNIDADNPEKSKGLSAEKAREMLEKNGPNKLPAAKQISNLQLFLSQFLNQLWILLAGASVLSLIGFINDTSDIAPLCVTIILIVMIVVMCFVSFSQERKARKVVRGFENLLPQQCVVKRDGNETAISAEDLVVGDIIKVKSGIRVPADARILLCVELKLESSSITGEAEPVEYQADAVDESVNIFDSRNVAFNGSMCTDGEGVALVTKTATHTIIGHIAKMTTGQPNKQSRLENQINIFVKFLTVMAIVIGVVTFVVGGFVQHWQNVIKLLMTAFTVCAVAMIPEGMPATVTSIITLVARRLAQKNVYLKRLDIVEALGSANIIASDKTGTLTKNEMTVTDVWYSNEYITEIPDTKLGGNQKTMTVKTISKVASPLSDLLIAMTVCNTATFDNKNDSKSFTNELDKDEKSKEKSVKVKIDMPPIDEEPKEKVRRNLPKLFQKERVSSESPSHTLTQNTIQRRTRRMELIQGMRALGAPSEVALIKYAEQLINVHEFRRKFNVVFEIPFNSKRKFHLVITRLREVNAKKSQYLMMMKGAPEIVIKNCSYILSSSDDGESNESELSVEKQAEFQKAYDTYGEHGRRVIGFAHKYFNGDAKQNFSANDPDLVQNMVFLGVCAIMDPPRDETTNAIRECKEAGIKVFMVTGDHHITATAIAKQIGLIGSYSENGEPNWDVVKGEDIPKLSSANWDRLVAKQNIVFARTTPEHKYRIVEECQRRNQIISMTGDGVNDAPALKKSDIGVGMGSGSDVAKQAADIVLVDDNFSSMVGAVEEGRLMFDNIKKMMLYVLTHAFPELWALFVHYLFGMPLGTSTLMILSIDLGTELLPGIALCKEPIEGDIMKIPPRKTGEILIGKPLLAYCYGYTGHIQSLACFLAYCSVFWFNGISLSEIWMTNDTWTDKNITMTLGGAEYKYEDRHKVSREARSAWQIGIVLGQVFHIYSCRTLRQSMFTHGFFSNKLMNVAVVLEIIILLIYVYVPGVNEFLDGGPVDPYVWAIVTFFGIFIFVYNELRKYAIRTWPDNYIVQFFTF